MLVPKQLPFYRRQINNSYVCILAHKRQLAADHNEHSNMTSRIRYTNKGIFE
jgi:hypothetical protein